MTSTSTHFLYVTDVSASATFYARLLDLEPTEVSATFVLFVLSQGITLGLWEKADVQPAPLTGGGGGELGFKVAHVSEVDRIHEAWVAKGASTPFPPTDLDFGRSFVALDPDGHRLRVYAVAGDQ